MPIAALCTVVVGGRGTSGVCLGGEDASDKSTLVYASNTSPSEFSGTQAKRNEEALTDALDEEEVGRSPGAVAVGFCCTSAMKPAILSFEDGVGCM